MKELRRSACALFLACASGCELTQGIGALGGSDVGGEAGAYPLPIGDASYGDLDEAAFAHVADALEGQWHGVMASASLWQDEFSSTFDVRFMPSGERGRGTLRLTCLEKRNCVRFAIMEVGEPADGEYRLIYVNSDRVGEGDLALDVAQPTVLKFRSLLLNDDDQVLTFILDLHLLGSGLVVLKRGPWRPEDAGAGEAEELDAASDAAPGFDASPRSEDAGSALIDAGPALPEGGSLVSDAGGA